LSCKATYLKSSLCWRASRSHTFIMPCIACSEVFPSGSERIFSVSVWYCSMHCSCACVRHRSSRSSFSSLRGDPVILPPPCILQNAWSTLGSSPSLKTPDVRRAYIPARPHPLPSSSVCLLQWCPACSLSARGLFKTVSCGLQIRNFTLQFVVITGRHLSHLGTNASSKWKKWTERQSGQRPSLSCWQSCRQRRKSSASFLDRSC
jgi:hypothetical protein